MFSIVKQINVLLKKSLQETGLPVFIPSEENIHLNHSINTPVLIADVSNITEYMQNPGLRISFKVEVNVWTVLKKTEVEEVNLYEILSNVNGLVTSNMNLDSLKFPPILSRIESVSKLPFSSGINGSNFIVRKSSYIIEIEQYAGGDNG